MTLPQRIKIAEQLVHRLAWPDLDLVALRRFVATARNEAGPPASPMPGLASTHSTVDLIADADTLVCGAELVPVVLNVFQLRDGGRAWMNDGAIATNGTIVATFAGPEEHVRPAVEIARTMIRRLSGIASFARMHASALGDGRTRLLDNGEFTPGWRMIEKYALACGGAWDGGSGLARIRIESRGRGTSELESEIRRAREISPETPVEVTVRDPRDVENAAAAAVDLVRLEGFATIGIREAVASVNGRAFVEAHGGITLSNIAEHAGLGLDFVSVDGLVSEARWAPLGALWRD